MVNKVVQQEYYDSKDGQQVKKEHFSTNIRIKGLFQVATTIEALS